MKNYNNEVVRRGLRGVVGRAFEAGGGYMESAWGEMIERLTAIPPVPPNVGCHVTPVCGHEMRCKYCAANYKYHHN